MRISDWSSDVCSSDLDPLRNELFTASRGSGMQVNERRMRVADRRELTGAVVITGFPPRERKRAGAQLKCVGDLLATAEDVRRTGSAALDLAYVACGRSDAYFESGRSEEHTSELQSLMRIPYAV